MGSFLDKMSSIFFREVEDEEEESAEPQPVAMPNERKFWNERETAKPGKKTNLMTIPGKDQPMEMVLIKATCYDDLQEIAANIKSKRVVVCNFEDMDKDTAQRMVDFLSGAVFALDGQPKKVSGGTFIFSSSQVDLSGQIMDGDLAAADRFGDSFSQKSFQWLKK